MSGRELSIVSGRSRTKFGKASAKGDAGVAAWIHQPRNFE